MKYKVGDKVRIREDLVTGGNYGGCVAVDDMTDMCGSVVTIERVGEVHGYYIKEDPDEYCWKDEMFEPVEEELTAEEAIKIQAEMCSGIMCKDCAIEKLRYDSHCNCVEYRSKNPDKAIEILKQWKKDHEKKEVETEFVNIVRLIEDLGYSKRCVYEEDVTGVKVEKFKMTMKRILEEYCKEHDGKFFTVYEEICRVKE